MNLRLTCPLLLVAALLPPCALPAAEPIGFVRGHSWGWVGTRGDYAGPEAAESMRRLAATGADTVCLAFAANMTTFDTPTFAWADDNPQMVTDQEVRRAIGLARDNGLRVILKPTVNCADGTWRAWIRFHRPMTPAEHAAGFEGVQDPWGEEPTFRRGEARDATAWDAWWRCYSDFLHHYAQIAEQEGVEAFCLGCEMNSTEAFVDRWREVIARVRTAYHGPLTYNANHGRERLAPFWDAVDFLSVSAYYPVPPPAGQAIEEAQQSTTPKEQIIAELRSVRDDLREVAAQFGKPILFIETGVTNVRGAARAPWTHPYARRDLPIDDAEQANYYSAMFETFWDEPWLLGFTWWDWPARLYPADRAPQVRSFCVYSRPAERIVRDWYARPRRSLLP